MRPLVVLAGLLAVTAMGSEYRGCGNASAPPSGTPLPTSTAGCVTAAECAPDPCARVECIGGTCVPTRPRPDVDGDADGFAGPGCGEDCNDADPNVFPGAAERCNGRDDDCDGRVDEGATGVRSQEIADGLFDAQIVGLDAGFAVVGLGAEGELIGYVLRADGFLGPAVEIVDDATTPIDVVAADADGTRIVVAFAAAGAAPQALELVREGDGLTPSGSPQPLGGSGDTTGIDVHFFEGEAWVAFDVADVVENRRWLWSSSLGALASLVAAEETGPWLADDARSLVATSAERGIEFIATDGSRVGAQTLPGSFASGRAIASGDGAVVAAYRDSFDHNLTAVTTTAVRSPITAPYGARADTVAVHGVPDGVLVTRASPSDVRAWILAPDLRTYRATFTSRELSPYFTGPSRVSAATDRTGASAILSSYPGSSVAAFLACSTAP